MPENTAPAGKSNVMSLYANEFDGGFKVVTIFLHFVAVKLLFINSNLSNKIQVLEAKSVSVSFASTKTQGRPNKIAIPLSKDYRGIRKCIYLEQASNADWVECVLYGIDDTNCYIQYQNYFTSAIAGTVTIRILG